MKFLPITLLVPLLLSGCNSRDPLSFISAYHKTAAQCAESIDRFYSGNAEKTVAKANCEDFAQEAQNFEKALNGLIVNHSMALQKSVQHQSMLSEIMAAGFKYSTLNSPENQMVVVLSSPNVIRMIEPTQ